MSCTSVPPAATFIICMPRQIPSVGMPRSLAAFARAVAEKNFVQVAALFRRLPADSVYRIKAQPDHDRLKEEFVQTRGSMGEKYAAKGRCREQRKLAAEATKLWPEAGVAVSARLATTTTFACRR